MEESDSGPFHMLGKHASASLRGFESHLLRKRRHLNMETSQEILQEERVDTKSRLKKLVEIGKPILGQTALIQERDFTDEDIAKVREFFETSKPLMHPNVWPSYWEHVELASRYARIFGKKLQDKGVLVNPHELEVLGMIHDIGRIISPHRFFRTNLVGEALLKRLGVREDLIGKQVPEMRLFGRDGNIASANQLTIEQQVLMLADNLGRKVEDGSLISFEQIGDLTDKQVKQYSGEVFVSERFGKRRLVQTSKKVIQLLDDIKDTLQAQYGISIDEVRGEVAKVE